MASQLYAYDIHRMNRYGPRRKGLPASQILTYNDLLFCLEYARNGQNGTHAYKKVHPAAKLDTARAEAVRVLAKQSVREQLDRMYKAAIPDTIETIKRDLDLAWSMALEAKDYDALDRITMNRAKLAKLLVDQVADVTDDANKLSQPQLINELRSRLNSIDAADGSSDGESHESASLSATENVIRSDGASDSATPMLPPSDNPPSDVCKDHADGYKCPCFDSPASDASSAHAD